MPYVLKLACVYRYSACAGRVMGVAGRHLRRVFLLLVVVQSGSTESGLMFVSCLVLSLLLVDRIKEAWGGRRPGLLHGGGSTGAGVCVSVCVGVCVGRSVADSESE